MHKFLTYHRWGWSSPTYLIPMTKKAIAKLRIITLQKSRQMLCKPLETKILALDKFFCPALN